MSENNEDLLKSVKSGGRHDSGEKESKLSVFEFSCDKGVTKM
jgi:hypothetical protein